MSQAHIGLIGLAVMGQNLVLNMNDSGFVVAVFNRTTSKVDDFLQGAAAGTQVIGCHSFEELVNTLKRPRKVMLMVKAGQVVDAMIESLLPHLESGDIIIDGGNSLFVDTNRRCRSLADQGILYVGTGVSGGEEGARFVHHAGWRPARLAGGTTHISVYRRQSRRRAVLPVGRGRRGRSLRQDGAQRHRVRRYAAHLRSLPTDAGGAWALGG